MHSEWTDLLSAYLDDELDPVTRRRLETHLTDCADCRSVEDDLRRIVGAAPAYRGDEPSRDLWPAIATEVERGRVVAFPARVNRWKPLQQLLAAGIVLAAGGAGGAWFWLEQHRQPVQVAEVVVPAPAPAPKFIPVGTMSSAAYDTAIAQLERTLEDNRGRLDTTTVRIVERSLQVIDKAIAEARIAIQRDSANSYLNGQIAANMRKKINVLRLATRAIASET